MPVAMISCIKTKQKVLAVVLNDYLDTLRDIVQMQPHSAC